MTDEPINVDQVKQEGFELGLEHGPMEFENVSHFQESATYANEVLPKLREIAGVEDAPGVSK